VREITPARFSAVALRLKTPEVDLAYPSPFADLLKVGLMAEELPRGASAEPLLGEEEAALGAVSDRRRREFIAGRTCARRALIRLGVGVLPVVSGPHREPLWPKGVVGSISHCRWISAAVVGYAGKPALSIGIDVEEHRPLPIGAAHLVLNDHEQRWIHRHGEDAVHWDTLLFSAKESMLKAWSPLVGSWPTFQQISVALDPIASTFSVDIVGAQFRQKAEHLRCCGRFVVGTEMVRTVVTVHPAPFRNST
jgi:4'-phosphopantetheinyl transferase EntD